MVWSASTLWIETADKGLASTWLQRLAASGIRPGRASATRRPRGTVRSPSPVADVSDPDAESPDENEGAYSPGSKAARLRSLPKPSVDTTQQEILAKALAERDEQITEKKKELERCRQDTFACRRQQREEKTKAVKSRGQQLLDARLSVTKEHIRHNARRFLPSIERCETEEEAAALRTASFQTIIAVVVFRLRVRKLLTQYHSRLILARFFLPLMHIRRLRKRRLALIYSAIWRGLTPRVTVEQLQQVFPQLASWTYDALEILVKGLRRVGVSAGQILFHEGEPFMYALLITHGKVSMRQRMPNNQPDLLLGDRGAGYAHGDEQLFSSAAREVHPCKVMAVEATFGWAVHKAQVLAAARHNMMSSKSSSSAPSPSKSIVASSGVPQPTGPRALVKMEHVRANRSLACWSPEDIDILFDQSTVRTFAKGETIYSPGEKGSVAFLVLKGTVELTLVVPVKETAAATPPAPAASSSAADMVGAGKGKKKVNMKSHKDGANGSFASLNSAPTGKGAEASGGDATLQFSMSFSATGAGGDASALLSAQPVADAGGCSSSAQQQAFEKTVTYANVGKIFGDSSVIFSFPREDAASAATAVTALEIPHCIFMSGMFSDPEHLCTIKQDFNKQRAQRLFAPQLQDLSCLFASPVAFGPVFLRCMRPEVASKGETLPIRSSVVFLHSGKVTMFGRTYCSPCLLLSEDALKKTAAALEAAIENGSLTITSQRARPAHAAPSQTPAITPSTVKKSTAAGTGGQAASSGPLTLSHTLADGFGDGGAAAEAQIQHYTVPDHVVASSPAVPGSAITLSGQLLAACQARVPTSSDVGTADFIDLLADELLDGLPVIHRTLTRVDCWCVRYVDFLLRFRQGAAQLSDYVSGQHLAMLTPPQQDQNN
jgi:CRP-like cAMP-binding protein